MSMLKNAVDSIAIGLEDFESSDDRRVLSATRNIFAGILLLFKYKLSILSPLDSDEVLIKQKVLPRIDDAGQLAWLGKGGKTVDVQSIRERFDSLGIKVDWGKVGAINDYRNKIEHYYDDRNIDSVQRLISSTFLIVRDFIVDHLEADPIELLGPESWSILVETNDVYQKELFACQQTLDGLDYFDDQISDALKQYGCRDCGSGLLEALPDPSKKANCSVYRCRSCQHEYQYEEIIAGVMHEYLGADSYIVATSGGEDPLIGCPHCGDDAYLYASEVCASCGESAYHICNACEAPIPASEISDSGRCSYCEYRYDKIMSE